MRKHFYIILLSIIGFHAHAQTYNYTDLGILFSSNNNTGTARFTGLNGAMGAVGGDLSSLNINPAGIAIYHHSEISLTYGSINHSNETNYYESTQSNQSTTFNRNQVGAVIVFDDPLIANNWSKVSFAINHQRTANFHTRNSFFGNSRFPSFISHPNDPDPENTYENAISQSFYNYIDGKSSKLNLALAGQYGKNFYAGFSLNIHHLDFSQSTTLNELSTDEDDNILDALTTENLNETADGFSINVGFIYKPIRAVRLGLSFESPIWYELSEEANTRELIASIPAENIEAAAPYTNNSNLDYLLRTPSKLSLSGALVIGKIGFINLDYTYKAYNTLSTDPPQHLSNLDPINNQEIINGFKENNQYFSDVLQNTHNINIGGEFRVKNTSLRFGVGHEQSPFRKSLNARDFDILSIGDQLTSSLGAGFRFGASRLDLAYRKVLQNNKYDFNDLNQQYERINAGSVNNKNSRIIATYTCSF